MYVSYNELPNSSRVWVYQSDREFTQEEVESISAKAILFIDKWFSVIQNHLNMKHFVPFPKNLVGKKSQPPLICSYEPVKVSIPGHWAQLKM